MATGLNSQSVEELARSYDLIVSVDCGITAVEPARVARDAGVDLIITDHHELPDESNLPDAHTIVHPRLVGSAYPFGYLCGAGVAFKLAWQFAKLHCGSERVSVEFRRLLLDLLSLVALGTIADVVPLVDENRVLTRFGLSRIKQTRFVGLNALIDAAGLRGNTIDADHVGFVLGPRLNACGRMGHADKAVRLLTKAGSDEAADTAVFLTQENEYRRRIEKVGVRRSGRYDTEAGLQQSRLSGHRVGQGGLAPGCDRYCGQSNGRYIRPTGGLIEP